MLQLVNKKSDKGPLWLVEQKYVLGSDSRCDITIVDESVRGLHAELLVNGDDVEIVNLIGGLGLNVNGQIVSESKTLKAGDVFSLGKSEFTLVDPKAVRAAAPIVDSQSVWSLKALNTALADKSFPLQGTHIIGRSQESDICLGVVHLSRKHAKISVRENGLHILDLNSANGTFINNKKVSQALAVAGDELCFDTLRFRVIGPSGNNKVMEASVSNDADLTTVRPALQAEHLPPVKPAQKASKQKSRPDAQAQSARSSQESAVVAEPSDHADGNSRVLIVVTALILGVGLAWYFLG